MRSITFEIEGRPRLIVTVTETADGGLAFELTVSDGVADIRGLFFDLKGATPAGGYVIEGDDVTGSATGGVIDLGKGANMRGGGRDPYDVGVAFGGPGVGRGDDIGATGFTLYGADGTPLTLDMIAGVEFGARLTSTGEEGGLRKGSSKITTIAPAAPDARDDAVATDEDHAVEIDVLANDTDADGDPLTATVTAGPQNGALTANADGTFTYTPNPDFNGTDSFTYAVSDGAGGADGATVFITVNPVNDDPVAADDAFTGDENTVIAGNVLADNGGGADSDVDGDALSVIAGVLATAEGGAVTLLANGDFTYVPAPDFDGFDSFDYTVIDGAGGSDVGTVTLEVLPVGQPPLAQDDHTAMRQGGTLTVAAAGFLFNDIDPDGGAVTAVAITDAADNGTLSAFPDGNFSYTPNAGFSGVDSFSYRMRDDEGNFAEATVSITVVANRPPVARDDAYAVREGETLTIAAAGFLLNDIDPDGGAVTAVAITDAADNGTLAAFPDGRFTYTPNAGFFGIDSFNYQMRDDDGNVATATVSITVIDNLPPVALDDAYAVREGGTLTVAAADGFLLNDIDPDGGPVTAVAITDAADNGTLTAFPDGRFTYTPNAGFFGVDSFDYQMRDDDGNVATATVNITVVGPDDASVIALDDAYAVREGETLTIAAAGFLTNDIDPEGAAVTAVAITDAADNGTLAAFPDGRFTYTPDAGFFGVDSFDYQMRDDDGNVATATVNITVIENLPPVALDDAYAVREGGTLIIAAADGFLLNDLDPEGDPVTAVAITDAADNGTLAAFPDGRFTYTPDAGFFGVDSFDYQMRDDDGNVATATVSITVIENLPPLALDDLYAMRGGETLVVDAEFGFIFNDVDPEGGAVTAVAITDAADNGTLAAFPDGRFTYTPDAGFTGYDSFSYQMRDDEGNFADATVTIAVVPPDEPFMDMLMV